LVDTIVAASGASLKMTWPDAYVKLSPLEITKSGRVRTSAK